MAIQVHGSDENYCDALFFSKYELVPCFYSKNSVCWMGFWGRTVEFFV